MDCNDYSYYYCFLNWFDGCWRALINLMDWLSLSVFCYVIWWNLNNCFGLDFVLNFWWYEMALRQYLNCNNLLYVWSMDHICIALVPLSHCNVIHSFFSFFFSHCTLLYSSNEGSLLSLYSLSNQFFSIFLFIENNYTLKCSTSHA